MLTGNHYPEFLCQVFNKIIARLLKKTGKYEPYIGNKQANKQATETTFDRDQKFDLAKM